MKRARIDWPARRAEVTAIVAAGGSLLDVAAAVGCGDRAAAGGIRRLGLRIDADASRARRIAALQAAMAKPEVRAKRHASNKRVANTLKGRSMRASIARESWESDRARRMDALMASIAAEEPGARAARMSAVAKAREAQKREARRLAAMTPGERLLAQVGQRKLPPAPVRSMATGFWL